MTTNNGCEVDAEIMLTFEKEVFSGLLENFLLGIKN